MMSTNLFPAAYEFERLAELPASRAKRLFYPGATAIGGRDGLNIHIIPHGGEEWIGTFAAGGFGPKSVTEVCHTPNPNKLCVVSEGQGYVLDVRHPKSCDSVPIFPVLALRSSAKHRLLIFANHTELLALGEQGVAWRTARLSWDSLKLTSMTDDELSGVFWDIRSESEQSFKVNLANGTHTGGADVPPTPDSPPTTPRG
jgi:hypothetical protein